MYSPTARLLTVLELLQSHRAMSGSELARRLEVDTRTVRRYIMNLQDMGIPVEGERGPYGAYQLRRGYKLPPLMFSDTEAVALALGLLAIRAYKFPVDVAAVEGALAKTERVMPEKLLHQVRGIQEAITFNVSPPTGAQPPNAVVITLSSAAQQRLRVYLEYRSWAGEVTARNFDPYGIVFNEGYWYTSGYCHLRQGLRTFRLDRVVEVEVLEQTFERPKDFNPLEHVLNSLGRMGGMYEVEAIFKTTMEHAQEVVPAMMGILEPYGDYVLFKRRSSILEWIPDALMALDFPVVIRKPVELQNMMRQMAQKALRIAGDVEETV